MSSFDEPVCIQIDRENRIAGTLVTPGTLVPGVLFVHGWGGSQEQYLARAREVAALGCMCLTFDLRGHAATEAQRREVSREQNLHDVLAAYDQLAAHPYLDTTEIAVVGSSYGGYLATILTTLRRVRWLSSSTLGRSHSSCRRCTATKNGTAPRSSSTGMSCASIASAISARPTIARWPPAPISPATSCWWRPSTTPTSRIPPS